MPLKIKIQLYREQFEHHDYTNFFVFASANCPDDINMDFYICILDNLISEFSTRFDATEYFDCYQICSQYISDPYTCSIQNLILLSQQFLVPFSVIQNELIELHAETSIKSKSIIDLWKNYSNYSNLQMMAARILSFFSSTYCY